MTRTIVQGHYTVSIMRKFSFQRNDFEASGTDLQTISQIKYGNLEGALSEFKDIVQSGRSETIMKLQF